jgi:hypothetical protein
MAAAIKQRLPPGMINEFELRSILDHFGEAALGIDVSVDVDDFNGWQWCVLRRNYNFKANKNLQITKNFPIPISSPRGMVCCNEKKPMAVILSNAKDLAFSVNY